MEPWLASSVLDDLISTETIRGARDQLARMLEAVRAGELTAPSGLVARLEGAITALEALLGDLTVPEEIG